MYYKGTLTDLNSKQPNGQPMSVKFRDKSVFEVLTHFSMLIEDCNLEEITNRIKKDEQKIKAHNKAKPHYKDL
mgnify:CR=1 FL=1